MRVVADQWGCPTYAADLATGIRALADASGAGDGGVYHLCNGLPEEQGGGITWWDYARAILDSRGYHDIEIEKSRTGDYKTAAQRPRYSLLGMERAEALGVRMRPWPEALEAFMNSPDLSTTIEMTDPGYWETRVRAEG
jgi:dTDP-4-dehydrorhamnose reductase